MTCCFWFSLEVITVDENPKPYSLMQCTHRGLHVGVLHLALVQLVIFEGM